MRRSVVPLRPNKKQYYPLRIALNRLAHSESRCTFECSMYVITESPYAFDIPEREVPTTFSILRAHTLESLDFRLPVSAAQKLP